jgi:hypothetical protein
MMSVLYSEGRKGEKAHMGGPSLLATEASAESLAARDDAVSRNASDLSDPTLLERW